MLSPARVDAAEISSSVDCSEDRYRLDMAIVDDQDARNEEYQQAIVLKLRPLMPQSRRSSDRGECCLDAPTDQTGVLRAPLDRSDVLSDVANVTLGFAG
jgi:hypothetical protein